MKKFGVFLLLAAIILVIPSCCKRYYTIKTTDGETYCLPCCKKHVEYSSTGFTVEGIKIPIPSVPIDIGSVSINPEALQQAKETTQILDRYCMMLCELLPGYVNLGPELFRKHFLEYHNSVKTITELALLTALKDGKAIKKWIAHYSPQAQVIQTDVIEPDLTRDTKGIMTTSIKSDLSQASEGFEVGSIGLALSRDSEGFVDEETHLENFISRGGLETIPLDKLMD